MVGGLGDATATCRCAARVMWKEPVVDAYAIAATSSVTRRVVAAVVANRRRFTPIYDGAGADLVTPPIQSNSLRPRVTNWSRRGPVPISSTLTPISSPMRST